MRIYGRVPVVQKCHSRFSQYDIIRMVDSQRKADINTTDVNIMGKCQKKQQPNKASKEVSKTEK